MTLAYVPPGVTAEELFSPSITPLLTSSANVCLVGMTQGYSVQSQQIVVPAGVTPFNLTVLNQGEEFVKVSSSQTFVSVTNAIDPTQGAGANNSGYVEGPAIGPPSNTTLSGSTLSGVTSLPVVSSAGFVIGQPVVIDTGGPQETKTVATIPDSTHITLTAGTTNAHNSGVAVTQVGQATTNDFTASVSTDLTTVTITPNSGGVLDTGGTINFVYRVQGANYYNPTRLYSQAQVENIYGPGFNSTGIVNPVSAASNFAFQNGASSVVIQALFVNTSGTQTISTTLSAGVSAGATSLPVVSSLQLFVGQSVVIDTGGSLETRTILTVPDATHITVAALTNSHSSGATVVESLTVADQVQPTDAQAASFSTWQSTLQNLRGIEDVDIVVPVVGQSAPQVNDSAQLAILQAVQGHLAYMQQQGQYILSIVGEDSSTDHTQATATTLRSHAAALRSGYSGLSGVNVQEAMIFVSPSRFTRALPNNTTSFTLGGQYVAAAIAGMLAGSNVAASISRKVIGGFTGVSDLRDKAGKDADGAAGLLVVDQSGANVQIRHAITISNNSVAEREIGVVRSKFNMVTSLVNTLDSQVVGQIPADNNAPTLINSTVTSVLQALVNRSELVGYSGIQTQILVGDPTTAQVRFSYQPAFPLNYIDIQFSLDLTGGVAGNGITVTP